MVRVEQKDGFKSMCCDEISDNKEYFGINEIKIWECGHCLSIFETKEEAEECCEEE